MSGVTTAGFAKIATAGSTAAAPNAILCGLIPGEMDNLIAGNFGHSSSHVLVQLQQSQLLRSPPLLLLSSTERDVRYKFPFIIRK